MTLSLLSSLRGEAEAIHFVLLYILDCHDSATQNLAMTALVLLESLLDSAFDLLESLGILMILLESLNAVESLLDSMESALILVNLS